MGFKEYLNGLNEADSAPMVLKPNEKKTILSKSGKKEAVIVYTPSRKFNVAISQIVKTGLGIEREYFDMKHGFKSYASAFRWADSKMN